MSAEPDGIRSSDDDATASAVYALAATVAQHVESSDDGAAPVGGARYELVAEIGRGGMGRVLEARDRQFGRRVAVKELDRPDGSTARFRVEAFVTANLEHPGVPSVYEWGLRDGGKPFYAMQLVRGRTLAKALADRRDLAGRLELLPAVIQVAHTLAYAHERGVVHRDVKPSNIVLGEHGEVALVDWGVAKVLGLDEQATSELARGVPDVGRTATGAVVGTPAYMAPEQARGDVEDVDARTDVFGVGAILYQLLSGRRPYDGDTWDTVVDRAREAVRVPIDEAAPDAPKALRAIVARAMALARAERYEGAAELARALEQALTGALTAGTSPIERVAGGVGFFAVAVAVLLAVSMWRLIPAMNLLGYGAWAWSSLGIAGAMLGGIEWWTRGRYRLGPLVLGLAATTLLIGVAMTFLGQGEVMRAAARPENVAEALRWRQVVSEGTWTALGNLTGATGFTALQIMLWAVGRRRRSG